MNTTSATIYPENVTETKVLCRKEVDKSEKSWVQTAYTSYANENFLPLRAVSITLIAIVISGQHSRHTSAPEQQYLTSS